MNFKIVDVTLSAGEPLHITPYSDVHWDSRDCDRAGWLKHYKERARLPNSRFINIGDFNNLVMPRDMKRHMPSASQEKYGAKDDYVGMALNDTEEALRSVPEARWDLWGMGNHEYSALKFHSVDFCRLVCERMGYSYGTYSGRVYYRIKRRGCGRSNGTVMFRLLYHHGAWGGAVIKGYGGAYRWAMPMGAWHVFVYGHNHSENLHKEVYWDVHDDGASRVYNRHFVNTGTWAKSLSREGQAPDYAEVAGHPPTTIGTPLIRVWFDRPGHAGKRTDLHWTVES